MGHVIIVTARLWYDVCVGIEEEEMVKAEHELFETGDVDAPDCIKDRNGEVVLGLCKKCGKGENQLVDSCVEGIEMLLGKTLDSIDHVSDSDGDRVVFVDTDNNRYVMFHRQDCCEDVYLYDICGNLLDIIGYPILIAECRTNEDLPKPDGYCGDEEEQLWTFYELATNRGSVTFRWFGSSNGYYSVEVSFQKVESSDVPV